MSAPPAERDFAWMASTLSPDIKLSQTPALPYGGEYRGHAGFQDWSRRMAEYFEVVDVQDSEIFEREGSGTVVVLGRVHLKVRRTGQELEFPLVQTVTVDTEKGLITEIRPIYWDVHAVNTALGV